MFSSLLLPLINNLNLPSSPSAEAGDFSQRPPQHMTPQDRCGVDAPIAFHDHAGDEARCDDAD